MTQIEADVARSTLRTNNAITRYVSEIDWEQRRYEIAKEILPFCCKTAKEILELGRSLGDEYQGMTMAQVVSKSAIKYANALIEELKNNNDDDEV